MGRNSQAAKNSGEQFYIKVLFPEKIEIMHQKDDISTRSYYDLFNQTGVIAFILTNNVYELLTF